MNAFDRGEAFRDYFRARYGPAITAYRNIAEDPGRAAALEYLLVTARKR